MVRLEGLLVVAVLASLVCTGESWFETRRSCNRIDCHVSSWEWSTCSRSCDSGEQEGRRHVIRHPHCGGRSCPHLRTTRSCNHQCCARDCKTSAWKDWTDCTTTCGENGHQSRSRSVSIKEACGGSCNDVLHEKRACNRHCCPVHCEVGKWSNFTSCSSPCGKHGEKLRTRDVLVPATCGGECSSPTEETQPCNRKCCPKECLVSEWTNWESCSASCGTDGSRIRKREILQAASCNGTCVPLVETGSCNRKCCPKNCKVSVWTNYTSCSASCGESVKRRSRVVTEDSDCGGECNDKLVDVAKCEVPCCRQDCAVGLWGEWNSCTSSCGSNGTQTRTRSKTRVEKCNGTCAFHVSESMACNRVCCPVHCEMRWSPWSGCKCDGTERRQGTVVKQHACNGRPCPAKLMESKKCEEPAKCHQGTCGHDGTCHCLAGYFGIKCDQKCPLGLYGTKCRQLCTTCPKKSCHHVTGKCMCPLLTYGPSCQHRLACGTGYHCSSGAHLHSSYAQCFVKKSTHVSHVTCPSTHHLSRCHCYRGCHPKTIWSSRLCHCECNPPSFLFFKRHYSAALCCPNEQSKPVAKLPKKVV